MEKNEISKRKLVIIEAAIKVIKEKSIEEATVREIADMAGLTTGAIYHHYKNKNELFYDVVNYSIHFSYKFPLIEEKAKQKDDELLANLQKEVALRLSKLGEQKLHILLLSDIISKDGEMKDKYNANYEQIISNVADLYFHAFGVKNDKHKKDLAIIFIAALDGIAMQHSLGIIPENQDAFIRVFNQFFCESIPDFLEKHK
jgi:AcrR family transcriptional regulator